MGFGTNADDISHMRHALLLAARGLGRVAPNPAVGCVIVSPEGHILGRGWTQPGGRPHAETVALAMAGAAAKGATAYVSLEPCSHHGMTAPCADALAAAGIARVVAAVEDPDPRVRGKGFQRLEEAGIAVTRGVLEAEARTLNRGFFTRVAKGRPLVALKSAESADGYVAGPSGEEQPGAERWITGATARRHAHLLRAQYDAILVGIGTVVADDPLLTCRLPGLEDRSPLRVVLDSALRLLPKSKLAQTAHEVPVAVFTTAKDGGATLTELGVRIERVAPGPDGRVDLAAMLRALAARGITRVLVEGGPKLHAAFLAAGMVDEVHIYRAPAKLKQGLRTALGTLDRFRLAERQSLSPDILESYEARG
jgi:diaminohydroxyphosphoribosylaminopyrimidine deaminase/5-amino-6-(5-phosphoribosylamino)uracil reductase